MSSFAIAVIEWHKLKCPKVGRWQQDCDQRRNSSSSQSASRTRYSALQRRQLVVKADYLVSTALGAKRRR